MNLNWKYEPSNVLCGNCDVYLGYHKRTKSFYCPGCGGLVRLVPMEEGQFTIKHFHATLSTTKILG